LSGTYNGLIEVGLIWEQGVASSNPAAPTNEVRSFKAATEATPKMIARIFKPARTAMQSGEARTKEWVLEFAPASPREIDPLMGWTSSRDMKAEIELAFETKEEAIAYAEREGLAYQVLEPQPRRQIRKSYADNFKYGRIGPWTH
jgi:ETC complex I subunit-like protein